MSKRLFFIFSFLLLYSFCTFGKTPYNMQDYRGKIGRSYTFLVTGSDDGRIWGGKNNVYTDDSALGKAAVHAGLVEVGETVEIQVTVLKDQGSYPSITRNGITSRSYGSYYGAYKIKRKGYRTSHDYDKAPANMTQYRDRIGNSYTFVVTGSEDGRIWGGSGNVYTDDSALGKAAVHAGLVRVGETAEIQVTVLKDQGNYPSITRNGITSRSYGAYDGAYKITRKGYRTNHDYGEAPANMTQYRNKIGKSYTFIVTGSDDGRIWGGSGNVYTDDSALGKAAVHAGLVRNGRKALIKVTVMRGRSSYPSVTRNGITSRSYGSYYGSYKIELVKRL